jgi:hypothetical protein
MAAKVAMAAGNISDAETDLYVPSTIKVPLSVPQLYTNLFATSPLISKFPIPVQPLIDVGSACTMISLELVEKLGL